MSKEKQGARAQQDTPNTGTKWFWQATRPANTFLHDDLQGTPTFACMRLPYDTKQG